VCEFPERVKPLLQTFKFEPRIIFATLLQNIPFAEIPFQTYPFARNPFKIACIMYFSLQNRYFLGSLLKASLFSRIAFGAFVREKKFVPAFPVNYFLVPDLPPHDVLLCASLLTLPCPRRLPALRAHLSTLCLLASSPPCVLPSLAPPRL
jgi:hypothetical protein